MNSHQFYLNQSLNLAKSAIKKGNHPFGAVIVFKGQIITAENEVETKNDITAHAELLVIQKAQKVLTKEQLQQSTLYTSTEPCAMCSGAIYWAGILKVVFGCSNATLCDIVGESLKIPCESIFQSGEKSIDVVQWSDQSFIEVHQHFWE